MSKLSIAWIAIVLQAVILNVPTAQSREAPETPSGTYSTLQCESSKDWLVRMHGKIKTRKDIAESEKHYAIWSSPDCVAYRKPRELNVTPEISETAALLRENGIDIEAHMPAKITECREKAPAALLAIPVSERATITAEEVAATCILNARTQLYSEALNELNDNRQRKFAEENAEYQRAKLEYERKVAEHERLKREHAAKVAATRAENERRQAEWRKAVALCKQGKREYCAQER